MESLDRLKILVPKLRIDFVEAFAVALEAIRLLPLLLRDMEFLAGRAVAEERARVRTEKDLDAALDTVNAQQLENTRLKARLDTAQNEAVEVEQAAAASDVKLRTEKASLAEALVSAQVLTSVAQAKERDAVLDLEMYKNRMRLVRDLIYSGKYNEVPAQIKAMFPDEDYNFIQ